MEWIVKIETSEEERKQRIKVIFEPMSELIHVYAEAKIKNGEMIHTSGENKITIGEWSVFSKITHKMEINLDELQEIMGTVVTTMRKRLKEYDNLSEGFKVLKWVGFEDED